MLNLEKFKDLLGKPGEGLHFHVAGIAIVDVLATILLGWAVSEWFEVNPLWCIGGFFVLGQMLHWVFGVETAVMRLLKKSASTKEQPEEGVEK